METRNFKRRNDGSEHGKCLKILRKQKYDIDMKTTTEQHTRKDNKPRLQHTCTEKKENTHMLLLGTSETTGSHRCYCFFTSHMNRVLIATSFTTPQIGQAVRSTTHGLQAQRWSHGSNIIQAPPELQTIQVRSVLVVSACHT